MTGLQKSSWLSLHNGQNRDFRRLKIGDRLNPLSHEFDIAVYIEALNSDAEVSCEGPRHMAISKDFIMY
jgi:hypothetical protein